MSDILTGVIGCSSPYFSGDFWEQEVIDLDYSDAFTEKVEEYLRNKEEEVDGLGVEFERADFILEAENHAEQELEGFSGTTQLYGSWKKDNFTGKNYEPDTVNGDFAAIYNADFNVLQVVWSKYYVEGVRMCSPCYPNQGDLDSLEDDGGIMVYCLPPSYHEGLILQKIRHENFLEEGQQEDFWYDNPDALQRLRICARNLFFKVGLDSTGYVPYSASVDFMRSCASTDYPWALSLTSVNESGVLVEVSCHYNPKSRNWVKARLFLDAKF